MSKEMTAPRNVALNGVSPEDRRKLLANGFEPIILNGKAPLSKGWQLDAITLERLASWESQYGGMATGTGLRTGRAAAVDIDLANPHDADAVCRQRYLDRLSIRT